jgi:hypothetical protein
VISPVAAILAAERGLGKGTAARSAVPQRSLLTDQTV